MGNDGSKLIRIENIGGAEIFGDEILISSHFYPSPIVHSVDVENDGDQDLIVTLGSNYLLSWLSNNGDGVLSSNIPIFLIALGDGHSLLTGDLDNDGDMDILTIEIWYNNIAFFENKIIDAQLKIIKGQIFWDENENGIFDNLEIGLNNQAVSIVPNASTSWSSGGGEFDFLVYPDNYTLIGSPLPARQLTTNQTSDIVFRILRE